MNNHILFSHAFQPIINTGTQQIVAYEALLRGKNNESPTTVYEQVRSTQRMAFDQINRKSAISMASGLGLNCDLNLNFTPGSILFKDGEYIENTLRIATQQGLSPEQIIFEITESEIIENIDSFLGVLNKLRRLGITIAIDDFGSGYSGLNLLVDVLPDLIKLDMHLIRNIDQHGPRQSIVRAIATVCCDLGIDLLAEGIETPEEYAFLNSIGVILYQGYYFAHPGFECLPLVESV